MRRIQSFVKTSWIIEHLEHALFLQEPQKTEALDALLEELKTRGG